MNKNASLKLNFIFNIVLTISSFIFPLITFPYISRILMPEIIGKINMATSIMAYFLMFAQLGIPTYGIRACSQARDDRTELTRVTQELLIINFAMSMFVYLVLFVCLKIVPHMNANKLLYVILSFSIFLNCIGIEWLYKGIENYGYITSVSIVFKFIGLISMFLFVHSKADYLIYVAITVISGYASCVLNIIYAKKYIFFRFVGGYNFRRHLKPVFVFFAMTCATSIYVNLDSVMLGTMSSEISVGYYGTAVKIRTILLSIVTSLGAVLLPRTSYYVKNGLMNKFIKINEKALRFIYLVAIPLTIYFILFAGQSIDVLSGPAFSQAKLPMQLIMPTVVIAGISDITGMEVLIPLGKEKVVLLSLVCGALIDFMINYMLIPILGPSGTAIGTTIAEIVVLLVQLHYLNKNKIKIIKSRSLIYYLGLSLLSCVFTYWTITKIENPFLCLIVSSICYFSSYSLMLLSLKDSLFNELVFNVFGKVLKKRNES